jgi:hypothetical protein
MLRSCNIQVKCNLNPAAWVRGLVCRAEGRNRSRFRKGKAEDRPLTYNPPLPMALAIRLSTLEFYIHSIASVLPTFEN